MIKKSASLMWRFVKKQYMVPYVGPFQIIFGVVLFYLSPVGFAMQAVTLYAVAVSPWAATHAPWLTLWMYLSMIPMLGILGLIFVFKFVLPSVYEFGNKQGYKHGNPFVADLQEMLKRQESNVSKEDFEKAVKELAEIKKLLKGEV